MYMFLLLALPCLTVIYNYTVAPYSTKQLIPVYTFGILAGFIFCAIKLFFVFISHIWTTSIIVNFISLYLHDAFIPYVIVYGLFLITTMKTDDIEYRIKAFTPLILSFMAIFIPYSVISENQQNVFFMIFIKPVLYGISVYLLGNTITLSYKLFSTKFHKTSILTGLLGLAISSLPALTETFWYLKFNWLIILLLILVQIILPLFYKSRKKDNSITEENQ